MNGVVAALSALSVLLELGSALNLADVPCGVRKVSVVRQGRIKGGLDAYHGQFPWSASVQQRGVHLCMGAIISRRYVVTAAHCFAGRPPGRFTVSVGGHNMTTSAGELGRRTVSVSRRLVHRGYREGRFDDDIALLRLSEPLAWSDYIQPICLPAPGADSRSWTGQYGQVAGWGYTDEWRRSGRPAETLQWTSLPLLHRHTCQRWFSGAGHTVKLKDGKVCAGFRQGGRDSCRADSGAALTLDRREGALMAGLVSAGIGCGRPGLPGIYTDVTRYSKWIVRNARG